MSGRMPSIVRVNASPFELNKLLAHLWTVFAKGIILLFSYWECCASALFDFSRNSIQVVLYFSLGTTKETGTDSIKRSRVLLTSTV